MQSKGIKHNLAIKHGAKPSPFKVDLLKIHEERARDEHAREKRISRKILSKVKELRGERHLANLKTNSQFLIKESASFIDTDTHQRETEVQQTVKTKEKKKRVWSIKQREKIERLAFYWFFKLLLIIIKKFSKGIYRLSYSIGWLVTFLIRFITLAGVAITKAIIPKSIRFRNTINSNIIKTTKGAGGYFNKNVKQYFKKKLITNQSLSEQPTDELIIEEKDHIYSEVELKDKSESEEVKKRKFTLKNLIPIPRLEFTKPAIVFTAVLILLILPFKVFTFYKNLDLEGRRSRVLGATESALEDMISASDSASNMDFSEASIGFANASDSFLKAEDEIEKINNLLFTLAEYLPSPEIKLASKAKSIIVAGELAARIGEQLSLAINSLQEWDTEIPLNEKLDTAIINSQQASINADKLINELKEIDTSVIPEAYRNKFLQVKNKSVLLISSIKEFADILSKLSIFLGTREDKRYLVVFQNNTELRATGGFIGSYALIDISNGRVKNIEAPGGGSYDTEAGLYVRVTAPEPLWIVNPLWHFWDANWWPDWPTSAEKLMWFFEKSDGPTVDGVISLTPTVIERLLEVTGPVDMKSGYGEVITADNFWLTIQRYSEQKADTTNQPKKIISDLLDQLVEELPSRIETAGLFEVVKVIEASLREKHILLYFTDQTLEKKVSDYGWDGSVLTTAWDYLQVVNTNIAGGKSDRVIKEEITQVTEILGDGHVIDTLKIERTHQGYKNQEFVGVRNNDWMRIYVPLGSKLLEAKGFSAPDDTYFERADPAWDDDELVANSEETAIIHAPSDTKIYEEFGKTVFANWSQVDPGESVTIYLRYELPFVLNNSAPSNLKEKINDLLNNDQKQLLPYALLIQKQPGTLGSTYKSKLVLPENFNLVNKYPDELNTDERGWYISDQLDTDKYWAIILEKLE